MEQRYMQMQDVTTRSDDNGEIYLEGLFAVYDSVYHVYPGATESIARGAFAESINGDVRALYNHNSDIVLGRKGAGTFELRDTDAGLWGRIRINQNDAEAMNAYARVQRGDITGCSIGFEIPEDGQSVAVKDDGSVHWTITRINPLYECSLCVFPAYEATHISARGKDLEDVKARELQAWKARMKARVSNGTESVTSPEEA